MVDQKHASKKQAIYVPAGFYMVRAPALPGAIFQSLSQAGRRVISETVDELDTTWQAGVQDCYQVLRELALRPDVAQAIAVASPSLQIGLERLQREEGKPAQQKKAYAGLLRYLIRMSTRPTPFGLFSGVALGTFAEQTRACLGPRALERFRTRQDMGWLLEVLHLLEKDRTLVTQLQVRLNQTAYLVGDRAVLPFVDTYGEQDNRTASLRATAPVRKVFELAGQFIPWTELCNKLQQAFPPARAAQIDDLLWQLWETGFLISQLHPPLTDARPAEYIYTQLDTLQGVDDVKAGLSQALERGKALDQAGIGAPLSLLSHLVMGQEQVLPKTEQEKGQEKLPLQVDAALSLQTGELHHSIGQAAVRAAEFLLRQTPLPQGFSHLQEYRQIFLEKYGEQAEVPLLDLLSAENGLDAPSAYEKPRRAYFRPSTLHSPNNSLRDQMLLTLLSEALNKQSLEVELTEEIQQRLERWSPNIEQAPLSLEIYLQLHARSREAIDRGEWTAVVGSNCGSPHAGRTFGRFFDLLGTPGIAALRELATREEALLSDVIFAELSYQPVQARMANVAIRPPIRSYEIAIGTTPAVPSERVLSLNDLVVSIENGHFSLRSLRLGRLVRVCQSHMLNTLRAPNVCRFISEIANDGQPVLSGFDWGTIASAPFLPRLSMRIGPTVSLVLTPARWHLTNSAITPRGEGSEERRWFRGLQQWREQWRVPRYVYLSEMDNRLLLDLEHPVMVAELQDEIREFKGKRQIVLEECLPDFEHLWLQDAQGKAYFSEIVIPVLQADTDASVKAHKTPTTRQWRKPRERVLLSSAERKRFPGEDWAYLKLYAAPTQYEALISGPLREVVSTLQEQELIDRWFFLRYADPEPHLRLRFHAKAASKIAAIHAIVLPWSACLARLGQIQRSTLDTYEREVERYGGPRAIDLLEQVFTADSTIVSNIIAAHYRRQLTLTPMAVAIWTLDQLFAAWGWSTEQRLAWTQNAAEKYAWSAEFRKKRAFYCDLFAPRGPLEPDLAEQRTLLQQQVRPHHAHLASLGVQVRELAKADKLWVSEDSLMGSLAHMHLNRLLGVDRTREMQIYAFWRHTRESLARRPAGAKPDLERIKEAR
jgi:thiopeptide-type bacteriocin biosynthesis protein